MKNISDYDFSRISAFVDGELETNEVYSLIADMQTKPELKDLYFNLLELSEVSVNLKSLGFKEKLAKAFFTRFTCCIYTEELSCQ